MAMTIVYDNNGTLLYHEPPFTEEEEHALYAMIANPPVAIALGSRLQTAPQPRQQEVARRREPEE
jgi:hypothetical protein